MRALVFLLLFANLLFFAYSGGYFGTSESPDAARVRQQVNPERIEVVGRGEPPRQGASAEGAKPAEESAPAAPAKVAAAPEACLAWAGLQGRDADRLLAVVKDRFSDLKVDRQVGPTEGGSWWVFIPPLPAKADADRKAGELKGLGVSDYFIVQDAGPNRYAISLGVFSAEAGANEHLASLRAKGVKSAKVGRRGGKEGLHRIEVRGAAERGSALQEAAASVLPGSRPQQCR